MNNNSMIFRPYQLLEDGSINTNLEIAKITNNHLEADITIPDWIAGMEIKWSIEITLISQLIVPVSKLEPTDGLHLLLTFYSTGTSRIFKFIRDVVLTGDETTLLITGSLPPENIGDRLIFSCYFIVDPDLTIERRVGSPLTPNTILWSKTCNIALEGSGAHQSISITNLGKSLWVHHIRLNRDVTSWVDLEWNQVTDITIASGKEELILKSIELMTAMTSELILLVSDELIHTPGGLEFMSNATNSGSFLQEMRKYLSIFLDLESRQNFDLIRDDWKGMRNQALSILQANILLALEGTQK